MNYKKIYMSIINNRMSRVIKKGVYFETHHIVPKSLGGNNDKLNLIKLTAKEHFICHLLLCKMYKKESFEWYKMNYALMMMKCNSQNQDRYFNSNLYEHFKSDVALTISADQMGKGNSNYGKLWISNIGTKKSKLINKNNDIPKGWVKGRNAWNKNQKSRALAIKTIEENSSKRARKYFNLFKKHNFTSVNKFSKSKYCDITQPAISCLWQKYIPEYKAQKRRSFNLRD